MNSFLLVAALTLGSADIDDGTLLYITNSNLVVEQVTHSKISHVGLVMKIGGVPYVYEATPKEVRRLTLSAYREEVARANRHRVKKMTIYTQGLRSRFSEDERRSIKAYLDEQLDRRYSVKSYVWSKPSDGIHCAELVANALSRIKRVRVTNAPALSPQQVVHSSSKLYHKPVRMALPSPRVDPSWCQRSWNSWFRTKTWCEWACYETWTFCR